MRQMEGNVAETYTLIYRFLKAQSHNKAAEAVKKAAKSIVVLHDDIEPKAPPLEDIIKGWKEKESTSSKPKGTDSSSEDDDSSDEDSSGSASSIEGDTSGSESDGDDTSDSDDNSVDAISKSSPPKPVERDTSVTLSSTGENARAAIQVGSSSKKSTENTGKVTEKDEKTSTGSDSSNSDSSDSDSSDSDSSSDSSASGGSDAESSPSSSGSSDTSDSSGQDDEKAIKPTPPNRTGTTAGQSTLDSSSESEDESDPKPQQDVHVAKKRKISENEGGVTTAVTDRSQQIVRKREKLPPKVKERFQRVKVQNLESKQLLDNGYEARGGAMNDYGERAHRDLSVTRGAGFRKEKNKKKRGSYRGGEITMENHSIRFNF